jgi:hypothetical protein
MFATKTLPTTLAASCFLLGASMTSLLPTAPGPEPARLAVKNLEIKFHEAFTCGDYDLMLGLWSDDAVFSNPAGTFVGPTAIADFLASGPGWGAVSSLSSNYKSLSDIRGNTADCAFECIIVDVSGMDPLYTPLSTIPFGSQNPQVEIVQHLNARCTAVRRGNQWLFDSFVGAPGPIMP